MYIRKATAQDQLSIIRSLQNKHIEYNTPSHIKTDIARGRLFVAIENNKIVAQCALVEEPTYHYTALKRLCIYNKKNYGKGIANQFIQFFIETTNCALGATPWTDNGAMAHLLTKYGFTHQYTFMGNYEFYLRQAD